MWNCSGQLFDGTPMPWVHLCSLNTLSDGLITHPSKRCIAACVVCVTASWEGKLLWLPLCARLGAALAAPFMRNLSGTLAGRRVRWDPDGAHFYRVYPVLRRENMVPDDPAVGNRLPRGELWCVHRLSYP